MLRSPKATTKPRATRWSTVPNKVVLLIITNLRVLCLLDHEVGHHRSQLKGGPKRRVFRIKWGVPKEVLAFCPFSSFTTPGQFPLLR